MVPCLAKYYFEHILIPCWYACTAAQPLGMVSKGEEDERGKESVRAIGRTYAAKVDRRGGHRAWWLGCESWSLGERARESGENQRSNERGSGGAAHLSPPRDRY